MKRKSCVYHGWYKDAKYLERRMKSEAPTNNERKQTGLPMLRECGYKKRRMR